MVFVNPPFAGVPDEHAHYWKAWSITKGYMRCSGNDEIPKTAQTLPDAIKPISYEGIKEKKIVVGRLFQFFSEKESDDLANIHGANCPSTPFGYFPQVSAFRIGSIFGFSSLGNVYFGRFLNMIIATLFLYVAIRIIPFGKIVLFVVGLLPLTIQQFASLSYDALQISMAIFFVAYVFRLAFGSEKRIAYREMFLLLFFSIIGLNIKLGYFPLMFLVLLIPLSRFLTKRSAVQFFIFFFLVNIGFFLLYRNIFQDIAMPTQTNPSEQFRFVLYAPIHFLYIVFETVYKSGITNYISGVLYRSGWGSPVPPMLSVAIFLWIVFLLKTQKDRMVLSWKHRVIIGIAFFSNFLLLYLALYMGWTPVGADKVSGVQGRYLISLLPLFLFLIYAGNGKWATLWVQKNRNALTVIGYGILFSFIFMSIYHNYYDKTPPSKSVYEQYLEDRGK